MTTTQRARQLLQKGLSRAEIARRLGMTPQGVSYLLPGAFSRRGRPATPDHVRKEISKLAADGLGLQAIATRLGVGLGTAWKYARGRGELQNTAESTGAYCRLRGHRPAVRC